MVMPVAGEITARARAAGAARVSVTTAYPTPAGTTPLRDTFHRVFPFGVFCDNSTIDRRNANTGATETVTPSNPSTTASVISHPDGGWAANAIDSVMWVNGSVLTPQTAAIEGTFKRGLFWQVVSPLIQLDGEWFENEGISHTSAEADTIASSLDAVYGASPSVLGYNLWDDLSGATLTGRYTTMAQAIARADDYGRAPSANIADAAGVTTALDATVASGKVPFIHKYPCGRYSNNTITTEGDFHRDHGGVSNDWVTTIRTMTARLTAGQPWWALLQAHTTIDAVPGPSSLRYPYPSELGMQAWLAIGEGAKGLFYFSYADDSTTGQWIGLGSTGAAARMSAVSTVGRRLTTGIRARLLNTSKATDAFSVSGGGSAGYPTNYATAYVSTLYDAASAAYYVVIVNHSASTASITVSGTGALSGATGTLTNLEDGSTLSLGGSVSLAGFDGSIWRYDG